MKRLPSVVLSVFFAVFLVASVPLSAQENKQKKKQDKSSWTTVSSPVETRLWDVHFATNKNVYAVGNKGTVLVSEDGGKTWTKQKSGSKGDLRGVHFLDGSTGYIVGDSDPDAPKVKRGHIVGGRPRTCGTLLKTTDGGQNWKTEWIQTNFYLRDIFMITKQRGQICNHGGRGHADGDRVITHNGGKKWYQNRVYRGLNDCFWINKKKAWAVGSRVSVGFIPEPESSLYKNKKDRIVFTKDGGKTWDTQPSNIGGRKQLRSIWMADESFGVAVGDGGTLLQTSNGGENWKKRDSKTSKHISSVCLNKDRSGWAAGKNGVLIKTKNGTEWTTVPSPTDNSLLGLHISPNGKTAVAVGLNGTIVRWSK